MILLMLLPAQLFAQFDTLLLLARGGKTVYFGDIGDNANTIKEYFGRHGMPCPLNANPAEHMIDVVSGSKSNQDWNKIWLESPEAARMHQELEDIITDAAGKEPGTKDDGHEFATSIWTQTKLVTHRCVVRYVPLIVILSVSNSNVVLVCIATSTTLTTRSSSTSASLY